MDGFIGVFQKQKVHLKVLSTRNRKQWWVLWSFQERVPGYTFVTFCFVSAQNNNLWLHLVAVRMAAHTSLVIPSDSEHDSIFKKVHLKFYLWLKWSTFSSCWSFTLSIPAYTFLKMSLFSNKIFKNISIHIHSLVIFYGRQHINIETGQAFLAGDVRNFWRWIILKKTGTFVQVGSGIIDKLFVSFIMNSIFHNQAVFLSTFFSILGMLGICINCRKKLHDMDQMDKQTLLRLQDSKSDLTAKMKTLIDKHLSGRLVFFHFSNTSVVGLL